MRITFKKVIGKIHLGLGLASGLIIFIVAITGAIYVFSDDIITITESRFTQVSVEKTQPLLPSQLTAIALKERQRFLGPKKVPTWDWATLYIFREANKAVRFSSRHYENPNQLVDIFINPYSGKVLHTRDTYAHPFWDIVAELHVSLMLGEVGSYVVRYSTLLFLVMLLSGIILWWPKNKAAAKQRFYFRWKKGLKWKRKNYDLHNILGFYASWITLFMVITGLAWSFEWFKNMVYLALNSKAPVENNFQLATLVPSAHSSTFIIDKTYTFVRKTDTQAYCYHLNFATKDNEPFNVYAKQTNNWAPGNNYYFNPVTGLLLAKKMYADLSAAEKYDQLSGDIHYGWIFGWPSKIAAFLACLITASLPITGFYIYWGRKRKVKRVSGTYSRILPKFKSFRSLKQTKL
ncbi:hypothetical protein AHMF7605_26070 [Adhaeribacter arboris]|uniref:PepSY domain-containing protein n=1 Tax=Adhaeribacter arboris TaxID=2072846 RepID=A0A2T2YMH9_9BACT|nr:PepSY-associated TM helix domain-containing protein [Adhaeribacter arboris]PSR56712.1 hypothetical protein AHMF7605_26070 [Adhaeribacter arboris]